MGVLLGAAALAVAAFPFGATWWGGWILAIAEAGIVGGLADWFAVTALFRRPLGLPIPHTGMIPANWELMAERVGVMVGDRVLTKDYVRERSRASTSPTCSRAPPGALRPPISPPRCARRPVDRPGKLAGDDRRPAAARPAARAHAGGADAGDHDPIARSRAGISGLEAMRGLGGALDRPEFRPAVGEVVDE